ncbi:MAG: AAA family ATPase [Gammaproteobacteria bacterium]|nr:AAA family ATPase [Gammaproteobacteria bacterium]
MLQTVAIQGYRSIHDLVLPLAPLTVITGENGTGKSNLYRALRLLSECSKGNVVNALAAQGGLPSAVWAGPETITRDMKLGYTPIQGTPRQGPTRLRFGFADDEFGYLIELGYPIPSSSAFDLDPVIKRECIFAGQAFRPSSVLVDRKGAVVKRRHGRQYDIVSQQLSGFDSMFTHAGDPETVPEVFSLQRKIQNWRFYSDFRTDFDAPARQSRPATRTPVLNHDGNDLPAALQTIKEIGDAKALATAIDDAFPGTELVIDSAEVGRLHVALQQPGLLRPLRCDEWSDGTLQYILLVAALLTPRPPELMVLNEPESSLHPDLLPALGRLIGIASEQTQVWVVSHSLRLVNCLEEIDSAQCLHLTKPLGQTKVSGIRELDLPPWRWPK